MYRSILPLSKTAHQMWRDQRNSQRKRTTERTVGVGVGGDTEVGVGGGQNLKKGSRQCRRGIGVFL